MINCSLRSLLFFVTVCGLAYCDGKKNKTSEELLREEKTILNNILLDLNTAARPAAKDGQPDSVSLTMHISVTDIDDLHGQFSAMVYFRQTWHDHRLSFQGSGYHNHKVHFNDPSKIWTPDTFIVNAISVEHHKIDRPTTFIRIDEDGKVLFTKKLSLRLTCPMSFQRFPFDTQVCSIMAESYGHTAEEIKLEWLSGRKNPINLSPHEENFASASLLRASEAIPSSTLAVTSSGSYIRISADIHMDRQQMYYVYHYFMPITMAVILSWCAFFIHPSKVAPRVILGIAVILAIGSLGTWNDFPKTSYIKCMDVWIGGSLCFTFFAFIETIMVTAFYSGSLRMTGEALPTTDQEKQPVVDGNKETITQLPKNSTDLVNWLDRISRIIFPIAFVVLALLFFIVSKSI